jgi:hypothetical protein
MMGRSIVKGDSTRRVPDNATALGFEMCYLKRRAVAIRRVGWVRCWGEGVEVVGVVVSRSAREVVVGRKGTVRGVVYALRVAWSSRRRDNDVMLIWGLGW